ncbi:hypothetical protein [Muricauda sp. MAR_2010_75]|uniref:hypothetical protein n=1 Tax=Allomuricauda sp. MAR_2010_75 TaxID=1250232 RepID=UPI0012E074DA|nr:hypothetical protein [Muricauda sp. MAR_2010_75]
MKTLRLFTIALIAICLVSTATFASQQPFSEEKETAFIQPQNILDSEIQDGASIDEGFSFQVNLPDDAKPENPKNLVLINRYVTQDDIWVCQGLGVNTKTLFYSFGNQILDEIEGTTAIFIYGPEFNLQEYCFVTSDNGATLPKYYKPDTQQKYIEPSE